MFTDVSGHRDEALPSASGLLPAARLLPAQSAQPVKKDPEYAFGVGCRLADLNVPSLDLDELQNLAAWLNARFDMDSGALSRKFGRPRSTVHGWVQQFQRLPFDLREAIIQQHDEAFLR